jgi:hypothetical protein
MFFVESIPWYNVITWFAVLGALLLLIEVIRMRQWTSLAIFIVLPIALTPVWFLFPDPEIRNWFYWAKVYSALAGSIIFMVIRFTDFHKSHKWYLVFPPAILGLNIAEAVAREFQIGASGVGLDVSKGLELFNMPCISGDWNYANAIAGILNIMLMCGWSGIFASRGKRKDMMWPDQIRLWVVAYGVWIISYVYSCSTFNAFYSGFALNIAATIPAIFWAKGAWLQHRAATLSFWMMWIMTFPRFFYEGTFAVGLSYNPWANRALAYTALALNVILACWQVYRIIKNRRNPLKDEIFTDLPEYKYVNSFR